MSVNVYWVRKNEFTLTKFVHPQLHRFRTKYIFYLETHTDAFININSEPLMQVQKRSIRTHPRTLVTSLTNLVNQKQQLLISCSDKR